MGSPETVEPSLKQAFTGVGLKEWCHLFCQLWGIGERKFFGVRLHEKIKRVGDRHLCHQVDLHFQFGGGFWEYEPGQIIPVRVLLPVDKMVLWTNFQ